MTSYECWWIDESPPGPVDIPFEEIMRVFQAVGRQWGKTAISVGAGLQAVFSAAGMQMTEITKVAQVLSEVTKVTPSKHGPRSGSQFDRRGRRRW